MPLPISGSCSDVAVPEVDDPKPCHAPPPEPPLSEGSDHLASYDPEFERDLTAAPSSAGDDQLGQALSTAELAKNAGLTDLLGDDYADRKAQEVLPGLKPIPPVPGEKASVAEYQSHLKGVSPDAAFKNFTRHFLDVLGAAGLRVYPNTQELRDGDRLMLHDPATLGPPPRPAVWAPVEVHVDPSTRSVRITTLDGHPLRGTNEFKFMSDGSGGTVLRQHSRFQGSSALINSVGQALGALDRQHEIWRGVHTFLAQPSN
jgi:hypothetical protein